MRITITFPDGTTVEYNVEITLGKSLEDIAEEIAEDICSRPDIKNFDACVEAHSRWILAQLVSKGLELAEAILGGRLKRGKEKEES